MYLIHSNSRWTRSDHVSYKPRGNSGRTWKNRKIMSSCTCDTYCFLGNRHHDRTAPKLRDQEAQQKQRENGPKKRKKENEKQQKKREKTHKKKRRKKHEKSTKARKKTREGQAISKHFPSARFHVSGNSCFSSICFVLQGPGHRNQRLSVQMAAAFGENLTMATMVRTRRRTTNRTTTPTTTAATTTTAPEVAPTERCRAKEAVMKRRRRRGKRNVNTSTCFNFVKILVTLFFLMKFPSCDMVSASHF